MHPRSKNCNEHTLKVDRLGTIYKGLTFKLLESKRPKILILDLMIPIVDMLHAHHSK